MVDEEFDAKVENLLDFTEQLLAWLDGWGINYSQFAEEFRNSRKLHKR